MNCAEPGRDVDGSVTSGLAVIHPQLWMLLILSQRCLKFENLKLDLLDFLESGDLAVIDLVVHARYPRAQEHQPRMS